MITQPKHRAAQKVIIICNSSHSVSRGSSYDSQRAVPHTHNSFSSIRASNTVKKCAIINLLPAIRRWVQGYLCELFLDPESRGNKWCVYISTQQSSKRRTLLAGVLWRLCTSTHIHTLTRHREKFNTDSGGAGEPTGRLLIIGRPLPDVAECDNHTLKHTDKHCRQFYKSCQ